MNSSRSEDAMPSCSACRVIVDPPMSGDRNMAIDEVLLNSGLHGIATLRFYQWAAPTVSLGHFQTQQGLTVPERFQGLPIVRRLSGGGAILHDQELTYSCVLPPSHALRQDPSRLYNLVHEVIINSLLERGVACRMRGEDAFVDSSFLCFSRGDERDIIIGPYKVVGSAQRRRQGATLQHGSILFRKSIWAPEFPGVCDLSDLDISPEALIGELSAGITQRLCLANIRNQLTAEETTRVEELLAGEA